MNKTDNFFKKFINCIYNLKALITYPKYGIWKAILYVLLMSIILGGIRGITIGYKIDRELSNLSTMLQEDKYKFNIVDGVLHTENSPLKIEETSSLIYIDENKSLNEIDDLRDITVHNDNNILFLKDGVSLEAGMYKQQAHYKELIGDSKLDNGILFGELSYVLKIIVAIVILYTILFTFINTLINCLFVTAFASFSLIIMKVFMKYSILYSLSLYACTLPFIFQIILQSIFPNINLDTMFIVGTLVYVIFILKYIKDGMTKTKLNKDGM
ncbi:MULTISPECIES: DUF1189 domain-containing protein [Clostridium]|uniref:DUF1189 domain-containing protein n=1 Tax=Clostridium TaxID=1485 RepID=UPI0002FCC6C1|nr:MULTISPECIES: DUF1189 domain-containing protein [Clostridium]MBN1050474.1 DUF1189 domain-containing protein [Clostridium botulinum]MBN1053760.1 DUF1189 domain-containing protein [Clostridium botulinum]NFN95405.1 DUF1189 domain-containing protein [Clostridium botulinum]NFS96089.1 DUF1189 domain-containing protein [Clostridium botulinum]NFT05952.1 DUF1189 domain-containing protein [Clostridium botulinum]